MPTSKSAGCRCSDNLAAHVDVLRERRIGVPEVVSDLACGQAGFVEFLRPSWPNLPWPGCSLTRSDARSSSLPLKLLAAPSIRSATK